VFRKVEKRIHGAPSAKWAAASTGSDAHPHVSFTVFAARGLPIDRKQEVRAQALLFLLRHHEIIGVKTRRSTSGKIRQSFWLWKCISQYQNDFSIHYGHPS
jgi:hypothetical protein